MNAMTLPRTALKFKIGSDRMQDLADEALILKVAQGDHAAFRALVDRHLGRATALAFRIIGNQSEAEELTQEAFLRVWTAAPRWRPDGAALFRTWFSRILTNLCIDRKRRPTMDPLEAAGEPTDDAAPVDQRLAERQEAAVLATAVAALPARQRAALSLCYWQSMSNIEAAQVLGLSVGAVESLLVRARRTLKEKLKIPLGRDIRDPDKEGGRA